MAIDIIRNIENLLQEHDCVVVEGLGAFVLLHDNAKIHNAQTISAPQAKVSFHANLQHDDGLLLTTLAKQHGITYIAARQLLMQEVQNIRHALQAGAEIQMGRLGSLMMQDEKTVFIPRSSAWLADNLGAVNLLLPKSKNQALSQSENQDYITLRFRREGVRYAAACVLGLALLSISPRFHEVQIEQYASLNPIDYAAIVAEKEAAKQAELEAIRLAEEEAARLEAEAYALAHPKNCHIVVASLDKKAADNYCQRLIHQGFENATVKRYKNTSRVIIDSYETRREALAAMDVLRQNRQYKRAWVWIAQ